MAKDIKLISNIAGSALADIAEIFQVPGLSTLRTVWDYILENKILEARDVLLDEIEKGDFSGIPQDDLVSIIHRYLQASINGSAKLNLRILARLIKGITKNDEVLVPGLYASEFNRYSNILADLTYEELQVLAALQKFKIQNEKEQGIRGPQTMVSQYPPDNSTYHNKAKRWLTGGTVYIKKSAGYVEPTQGKQIMTSEEFDATVTSLLRTGLIYMPPLLSGGAINASATIEYTLAPLFFKLTKLAEFQDLVNK